MPDNTFDRLARTLAGGRGLLSDEGLFPRQTRIPIISYSDEELRESFRQSMVVQREETKRLEAKEKRKTEVEELKVRKERAIVKLIETADEVEIEEMGDTNDAFNIGGTIGQSGVAGNLGKSNGVSHYRRYKFKRGGETTEIETPSGDQTEK